MNEFGDNSQLTVRIGDFYFRCGNRAEEEECADGSSSSNSSNSGLYWICSNKNCNSKTNDSSLCICEGCKSSMHPDVFGNAHRNEVTMDQIQKMIDDQKAKESVNNSGNTSFDSEKEGCSEEEGGEEETEDAGTSNGLLTKYRFIDSSLALDEDNQMNFFVGVADGNSTVPSSVIELNTILNNFVKFEVQKEDITNSFKNAFGPIFTKLKDLNDCKKALKTVILSYFPQAYKSIYCYYHSVKEMEKETNKKNRRKNRNQSVANPGKEAEEEAEEEEEELSPSSTKASITCQIKIGLGLPIPPTIVSKFQAEFAEAMKNLAEDKLPCIKRNETAEMENVVVVIRKPSQLNYFQNVSTTIGYIIAYERGDPKWDWTNEKGNISPPLSRLMRALDKRTTRIFNQMALTLFGVQPPQRQKASTSSSAVIATSASSSLSLSSALLSNKATADIFGDSDDDDDDDDNDNVANRRDSLSQAYIDVDARAQNNNEEEEALKKHKQKKKKRKANNDYGDDSCDDDAIIVENVANVMSKQLHEITRVKVAERHVFALLTDLQLIEKQIIELNIPDVSTIVGNSSTKLFVTNCTAADLGNLCCAEVGLGEGNRLELYPKHVTCIIGAQDLLAELILALSSAVVFQHVTTFSFLVPQGTTIAQYDQELTKRFWQQLGICETDYSGSGTKDVREIAVYRRLLRRTVSAATTNSVVSPAVIDDANFKTLFDEKYTQAQTFWKGRFTLTGGVHGTSKAAMSGIIRFLLLYPTEPNQICWDIGVGNPVFANLIACFLNSPVLGLDTDEYMQNFKAIQFPEVTRRSIVDVEEIYQASLRTTLCDPNFTIGSSVTKRKKKRSKRTTTSRLMKSSTKHSNNADDSDELGDEQQSSDLRKDNATTTTLAEKTSGTTVKKKYSSEDEEFQG